MSKRKENWSIIERRFHKTFPLNGKFPIYADALIDRQKALQFLAGSVTIAVNKERLQLHTKIKEAVKGYFDPIIMGNTDTQTANFVRNLEIGVSKEVDKIMEEE